MKPKKKGKAKCNTSPAPFVKCLLCGVGVKITKWRKHLGLHHGIAETVVFKDYFVSIAKGKHKASVKCRFCGNIVNYTDCSYHLRTNHNITERVRIRDYFVGKGTNVERVNRQWYNPEASANESIQHTYRPPFVRIIYTPMGGISKWNK